VGQYEECGKENGKTKYRQNITGATLQFDLKQNRWILVVDDKGSKTQYSSSKNVGNDVPWSKKAKMNGKDWRLDKGERHNSPLNFAGMYASGLSIS
jgi:hypothetical protein